MMRLKPKTALGIVLCGTILLSVVTPCSAKAAVASVDLINEHLAAGDIDAGLVHMAEILEDNPDDDETRYALGTMQFLRGVERMARSWHRYGVRAHQSMAMMIPFLRLPVPPNPNPERVRNDDTRRVLQEFIDDMASAEATLADITDTGVKLPLYFGRARFDIDGDGNATDDEALWRMFNQLNRRRQVTEEQAHDFLVNLDHGDVAWLRGYAHLLSGLLEMYLAHDDSKLFAHTATLFYANPDVPFDFLREFRYRSRMELNFVDAVAFFHLLDLPVQQPERMQTALAHFRQVTALSRVSWQSYQAESDDDHEWIPGPHQTGVIPGAQVNADMVVAWLAFLDELDAILAGEKLIPFWRGTTPQGVNLERVFLEPRGFDLVLWIQGTAAAPYLETGIVTEGSFWGGVNRAFDGRFVGFALWFN